MKIPNAKECEKLFDEFDVPERIRKHCRAVTKVAVFLAEKLQEKGINVDIDLVRAAAMLHDIDKLTTLNTVCEHGVTSCKWLSCKEHKKVGEVIKKHVYKHYVESDEISWEDKIVYYADKRCNGGEIVTFDERMDYARKRYPEYHKPIHEKHIKEVEKEIFNIIGIEPDKLGEYIE
jgi:putative nucleotidyltransferase with HDIG domain